MKKLLFFLMLTLLCIPWATFAQNCSKPTGVYITYTRVYDKLTVTWDNNNQASGWVVQYGWDHNFAQGTYTQVTDGFDTDGSTVSLSLIGLTKEIRYFFRVKAVCGNSDSEWSNTKYHTLSAYMTYTHNAASDPSNFFYHTLGAPIWGSQAAQGCLSQFIIPAEYIPCDDIGGGTFKSLTFYPDYTNGTPNFGSAIFEVYLKEVNYTTFTGETGSDLEPWNSMSLVYSGPITVTNGQMHIPFSNDYHYNNGNLMIGIRETNHGSSSIIYYEYGGGYGNSVLYAGYWDGIYHYDRDNRHPTVTISYIPSPYARVIQLHTEQITTSSATMSWVNPDQVDRGFPIATVTGYKYQYKKSTEEWPNNWNSLDVNATSYNTSVTLEGLDEGTNYDFRVKALYDENESGIASTSFRTAGGIPICDITFELDDPTGNDWDGSAIGVYYYNENTMDWEFLESITPEYNVPVSAEEGTQLSFRWMWDYTGDPNAEPEYYSWTIKAPNGDVITQGSDASNLANDEQLATYTMNCSAEPSGCFIKFELTDNYGDGWNGNAIQVWDVSTGVSTGVFLEQFANTEEADPDEAQTYYLRVNDGQQIEFQWQVGSFSDECSWVITASNGDTILQGNGYDNLNDFPEVYRTNCPAPTPLEQCFITLELTDNNGDGWAGNVIEIRDNQTGQSIGTYACSDHQLEWTRTTDTINIPVVEGQELTFIWRPAGDYSFPRECSWVIKAYNGDIITQGNGEIGDTTRVLATNTVSCSAIPTPPVCEKPLLYLENVTPTSFYLSWSDHNQNSTWQYVMWNNFDNPTDNESGYVNYVELTPNHTYDVYVRSVCGLEDYSEWQHAAITTVTPVVGDYWIDDFEGPKCRWDFSHYYQANRWHWDSFTLYEGRHALFISNNDNPNTTYYTKDEASTSYASRVLDFGEGGEYTIEYDWISMGQSIYDYFKVVIAPWNAYLQPGTLYNGLSCGTIPEGWIEVGDCHFGQPFWKRDSVTVEIPAGLHKVVLLWHNDADGHGENPPATIDNFSITKKAPCPPVSNIYTDAASHALIASWTSPTGNDYSNYTVRYGIVNDPDVYIGEGTSEQNIYFFTDNLYSDSLYYIHVRTNCDENYHSLWMTTSQRTEAGSCATVRNLHVDLTGDGTNSATISWKPSRSYSVDVYDIRVSTVPVRDLSTLENGNCEFSMATSDTTFSLPNNNFVLTPNTTYYVYVRTRCNMNDGNSDWVDTTFTTLPTCRAPQNASVRLTRKTLATVSWEPGNNNQGNNYMLIVADHEMTTQELGNTQAYVSNIHDTSYSFQGSYGQTYYFYVADSCDNDDNSLYVYAGSVTFPALCPPIQNFTYSNVTANTVQLSWNRGEWGAENEWRIERYLYSANTPQSSILVYDTSVVIFGLQPETTYSFQIQARCDETYSSIFSDWVTVTTLPAPDNCYTVANSTSNATTNSYSPLYGNYCDHQQRTQSIYPASMLTELQGKTITQMKYYVAASQNYNWRNKPFTVKLATVAEENLENGFVTPNSYTTVYTGTLYATMSDGMVITFSDTTPFTYQGGNLLVEFESTTAVRDQRQECWFYGDSSAYGSICEYGYSNYPTTTIITKDFLPKVTFCTEPSRCPGVRDLAVSNITGSSAHVSWMPGSSETMWQYILSETELSNQDLPIYVWRYSFDLFVNLSNLDVNTTYHIYVCPVISGNSYCSDEIRHASFTTIPTCLPPTNVTISDVTTSTATVSWEYVDGFVPENGWSMRLSTTPQFDYDDSYISIASGNDMNPFTFDELQAGTTYYLKMRSDCRTPEYLDDFSTWTEEYSFTTACDAIVVDAEHSFTENFDTTAFPPTNCWSRINSNTHAWSRVGASDYNHSGAVIGSAYSSFWGDVYLVLPDIALANDANDVSLSFWSKNTERYSYTINNNSVVLLDGNNETVLWSPSHLNNEGTEGTETTINLNQYKGQTIRLAFKHTGNTANPESSVNGWYLDDIKIAFAPATYEVTINQPTGGTIIVSVDGQLGTWTSTTANYNSSVRIIPAAHEGYSFDSIMVTTASGTPIEITDNSFLMPAEDVIISANFELEKHILTINYIYSTSGNNIYPSYKDTLEYGESYSVVSPPEWDGFYPSIDTVSGVMGTEDITMSVSYLPRVYNVTLHPRGGMLLNGFTSDTTYTRAYVLWLPTANDIVREGYSFGGWYRDTAFLGNPYRAIPNVSTGDWDLYAKWDINSYTITYLDGNDILDVDTFTYGANITPIADPTKEGYTFTGWDPELPTTMPANDVRANAQWQANKYNITLNQMTGGTITVSFAGESATSVISATTDTSAAYNAWVNLSVETDAGYTFGNYVVTTASSTPIEIINSGFLMPAEDVTVSANFELEKHVLTINYIYSTSGNDIYPSYKDTLEYGESYSVVSPPETNGFYPSIDTVSGVMGTEDITISVSYLPRVYNVTLHPRGGMLLNGFTSDTTYTRAYVLWLPTANDIVREGYSFGGWYRDTAFLGNPYRAIPNVSTGDWDLYAKWDINEYTVTVNVNPANAGTVTGAGTYNYGSQVEMSAAAAESYLFTNWTNNQGVVVSTNAIFDFEIANDTAFTANFTAMGVVATPTFSPAGGTYHDYDNVQVTLECATDGATIYYTTDGSTPTASSTTYSSPITITENTTIKAIAMKEGMTNSEMSTATYVITPTYTVTIANDIVNGIVRADASRAAEGETVNLTAIANNGYHFGTWDVTTATGIVEVSANNSFVMPASNVTISATFEPNDHTITYYNASGEIMTVDTFAYGDTITPIADPSVVGYTFTGWYPALPTTMPDYDLNTMAHWQVNRYRININQVQGGIVQAIEVDYSTRDTIVIDSADYGSRVQLYAVTNEGCTYNDVVVTDANGTVLSFSSNGFTMPASDVTVTPRFTIQEFTITYGDRGNIFKVDTFAYGANITPIADPTWEGHTFIGWDPALPITMPAHNLYVDALWQVNSYKVTVTQVTGGTISIYYYDENGHENNITTGDSVYYGAWIYFRRVVTDNGYNFNSYVVTNADGSSIATPNNSHFIMPANDVTVSANFDVRSYELTINYLYQNGTEAAPSHTETIEYNTAYSVVSPAVTGYTASQDTVMGIMSAKDSIVNVIYSINSYNITVNQVTGGIIYVLPEGAPANTSSNTTANYNALVRLTGEPYAGYSHYGFTVTTADGTPIAVQNNVFYMPANDVTVSANFSANEYTITYYKDSDYNIWEVDTFLCDDIITPIANPTREGYTFTGWSEAIPTTMPAHNLAVIAQWQVNRYNITINQVAGGTITVTENNIGANSTTTNTTAAFGSQIQLSVSTNNGYTFNDFVVTDADGTPIAITNNNYFIMPANDVTVTANFTANEYTITYLKDNEVLAVDTFACGDTIIPIADPTTVGLTFIGWRPALPTTMPAYDVRATAQWQFNKYRINIDQVQGGSVQAIEVDYSTPIVDTIVIDSAEYASWVKLSAVANEGYTFYGFVVTDTGGTVLSTTSNGFTMPASDVTVTATFTINHYTVTTTINPENAGTISGAGTYNYGTEVTLTATPATGYSFDHWQNMNIMTYSATETANPLTFTLTGDIEYKAFFTLNNYTITYKDGNTVLGVDTFAYGATITPMVDPTKEGYTFTGWDPALLTTMPANDVTVNAQWELIPCLAAENLAVANGSLTATSALITWNSSQNNTFGGVYYENDVLSGSNNQLYQRWYLSELQPGTNYRVGVFAYCSLDRISDTVWVEFTTNDTCYPPVSVSIDNIKAHEATLHYSFGEHVPDNYIVLISTNSDFDNPIPLSTSTSAEYYPDSIVLNSIVGVGLQAGTTYYLKMSSLCSTEPELISIWTEPINFTTLQEYAITIDANITNGTVSADTAIATAGTVINLTATPDNGYSFGEWTVTTVNTPAPETITVTNNSFVMPEGGVNVSATFTPNIYRINIDQNPGGYVMVIIEGSAVGTTIFDSTAYNTQVQIDVYTLDGYTFNGFTVIAADGTPVAITPTNSFTMPASDVTVSGSFSLNSYTVTTTVDPVNAGTVSGADTYNYGTEVTLTATPATGYSFDHWQNMSIMSHVVTEESNPLTFTLTGDVEYKAFFTLNNYTITYMNDEELFEVVTYNYGDTIDPMSGPEKEDFIFTGWNPVEPVTMPDSNMTLYAQWELIPCMTAENLAVANGSLSATSALVTWNSSQNNSFGGVLYENGVLTESESQLSQSWYLSELQPSTNYRVGVFAYCSFDRVSDTVWVEFTTNDTCYPPVSVSIDNIKAHEATLHYSFGEHVPDNYIVLISTNSDFDNPIPLSTSTSAEYYPDSIVLNSIVGVGLQAGTTYYLKMSSFCSTEPELISVWTEPINFTTLQEYALTIDANITNGTVTTDDSVATAGTVINLTATPDNGYSFGEWIVTTVNTPAPETITVTNNSFVMPEGSVNISATFTPNIYRINIDQNPGGYVMVIVEGSAVGTTIFDSTAYNTQVQLDVVTLGGYTFNGFTVVTTDGTPVAITPTNSFTMPASDVTVSGSFSVNDYTITYMDGNNVFDVDTFAYGATITPIANPTREGYTFTAWDPALPTTMPDSNITVYAQWQVNSYNISINQVTGGTITVSFAGESATSVISTTTDTSANFETWIQLSADANPGYNFVDFLVTNASGDTLEIPNYGFMMPAENVTVTATFSVNDYTITYMDGNNVLDVDTFAYGATITPIANPTREGYTFTAWDPALPTTMPDSNITVYAQWQVNIYRVNIDQNPGGYVMVIVEGSAVGTTIFDSTAYNTQVQLDVVTLDGYTFNGFSVVTTDGTPVAITPTNSFTMPASDVTVSGSFSLNSYTINVSVSDDTPWGTVTGSGSFTYGSTDTLTATPMDEHHIFVGWSDYNTENPRVITVTQDSSFTAYFIPEEIEIISNDTLMGSVSVSIPGGGHLSSLTPVTITANPEPHYHFVSWSDGNTNNPRTILPVQAIGLTAIFAIDQHTITVLSNDINMGEVIGGGTFDYGTEISLNANAIAGYEFLSWNDGNTDNPRFITVEQDSTFTAIFQLAIGINDINISNINVYSYENQIVVANAEGFSVEIFDISGRLIVSERSIPQSIRKYTIATDGIYLVKVGNNVFQKVKIAR